jgi:hypothetical protein
MDRHRAGFPVTNKLVNRPAAPVLPSSSAMGKRVVHPQGTRRYECKKK